MTELPRNVMGGFGAKGKALSSTGPATDRVLVGRRHRLDTAREWLVSGGSVLFFGGDGVGKSAALDVLAVASAGCRILRAAPVDADARRAFSTLSALFSTITAAEVDSLPAVRRDALTGALAGALTGAVSGAGETVRTGESTSAAVRLAALNLIRILARTYPLVLVVDDLQVLDDASADALRFIAPRVEDLHVKMAAAERVADDALPTARGLCPPPLLVVRLDAVAPDHLTPAGLTEPARRHAASGLRASARGCRRWGEEWSEPPR